MKVYLPPYSKKPRAAMKDTTAKEKLNKL